MLSHFFFRSDNPSVGDLEDAAAMEFVNQNEDNPIESSQMEFEVGGNEENQLNYTQSIHEMENIYDGFNYAFVDGNLEQIEMPLENGYGHKNEAQKVCCRQNSESHKADRCSISSDDRMNEVD